MNYYEHHIRDYDTATSHLTWEEDLAYTRLIRWYYRKEKPIPADIKEACRQVRAISKAQREAVAAVLREFFDLRSDGWHNETCDTVIAAFKAGEPEREAKKKNEDTRLSRHRQERSELFAVINGAGIHMPWNTKIEELRATAGRIKPKAPATPEPPETQSATQPATAPATPATATQTPDTRHQTPEVNKEPISEEASSTTNSDTAPPYPPSSASRFSKIVELLTRLERERGKSLPSVVTTDKRVKAWIKAGVTDDQLREAHTLAADQRAAENDHAPINTGFLDVFIAKLVNPKDGSSVVTAVKREWHDDSKAVDAKGKEVLGKTWGEYYYAMDKKVVWQDYKRAVLEKCGVTVSP